MRYYIILEFGLVLYSKTERLEPFHYLRILLYIVYVCIFSAITYGDPRIVTLDGVSYLFNGIGEYTVFEVEGGEFTIQGRTVQSTHAITGQLRMQVMVAVALTFF